VRIEPGVEEKFSFLDVHPESIIRHDQQDVGVVCRAGWTNVERKAKQGTEVAQKR
jgi:hypothetical protein